VPARRLKLPHLLTSVVVGAVAVAAVACGGDDAETEYYFCAEPVRPDAAVVADAGALADAGPADAGLCGFVVTDPTTCPPGCEPEPLG
jgi:hypothetical protein